jgi:hypothetical protein
MMTQSDSRTRRCRVLILGGGFGARLGHLQRVLVGIELRPDSAGNPIRRPSSGAESGAAVY